jgi:hypothetical protein
VFNQDVSKWNTGAVTNMGYSECTRSPSLFPLECLLNIRQLEFYRITLLTRFVIFVFVLLKRYLICCCFVVGWSFFSSVTPSLTVFDEARAFNQDVSTWTTGAVTFMSKSKCTLLSLSVATPDVDNSSFIGSQFSHVLLFLFCVFETV